MKKQLLVVIVLLMGAICFTSASNLGNDSGTYAELTTKPTTPGYDANGEDIDECALYAPCPEGYECRNLPGSYMCVGDGIELECDNSGSDFVVHVIYATCVGISNPICQAKCIKCPRVYKAYILGRAENIHGTCVCGSTSFSAY